MFFIRPGKVSYVKINVNFKYHRPCKLVFSSGRVGVLFVICIFHMVVCGTSQEKRIDVGDVLN